MNKKQIKLVLNHDKSHNHYNYTENEIYETIKSSLLELNSFYSRLNGIPEVDEEEKNALYNIIDIFWNAELDKDSEVYDVK